MRDSLLPRTQKRYFVHAIGWHGGGYEAQRVRAVLSKVVAITVNDGNENTLWEGEKKARPEDQGPFFRNCSIHSIRPFGPRRKCDI